MWGFRFSLVGLSRIGASQIVPGPNMTNFSRQVYVTLRITSVRGVTLIYNPLAPSLRERPLNGMHMEMEKVVSALRNNFYIAFPFVHIQLDSCSGAGLQTSEQANRRRAPLSEVMD